MRSGRYKGGDAFLLYIEARGITKYPSLAKYLSFVIARMYELTINGEKIKAEPTELDKAIKEVLKKAGYKIDPRLIRTFHAFYEAVRFGEVPVKIIDKDVEEDLRFIVPRVFLARRGTNIDAVIQAADEVYNYLDAKYGIPPELHIQISMSGGKGKPGDGSSGEGNGNCIQVTVEDKDGKSGGGKGKDKKKQNGQGGSQNVLPWRTKAQVQREAAEAVQEIRDQVEKVDKEDLLGGGLLGGPDHATLEPPSVRDVQFYLDTVGKHAETIRRLQWLFKHLSSKRSFVKGREGNLNMHPNVIQSAYVDSFKVGGADGKYYLLPKRILPDCDLVIAIDQSGSTYGTANLFAETVICLVDACKRTGKIRSGVVGFGDGIRVIKDFNEPVEAGRFYPQSGGGTPMGEGLEQTLRFRWRRGPNIKRVLVLATDGYPDNWSKVDGPIEDLKRLNIIPVALCLGVEPTEEFKHRFDQVYRVKEDASEMIEAFVKAFVEHSLLKG